MCSWRDEEPPDKVLTLHFKNHTAKHQRKPEKEPVPVIRDMIWRDILSPCCIKAPRCFGTGQSTFPGKIYFLSNLLEQSKTTQAQEAPWQQLQTLVFKWSVLISAFKWMQIFMRGAICRVEYSCGYGAGCPRSGPGKAVFLSPSLFWHADKEQQGKEARRRQSQGLPWSSPQTSRHWEKRAREDTLSHTFTHVSSGGGRCSQ